MQVTLEEAATQFAVLVQQAADGAEIIITQHDQPVAKLVGLTKCQPRQPGSAEGLVWMAPDFDEPLEDFKDYM